MKVRYSRRAVADLAAIGDYVRPRNPRAAEAVEKRIRALIDQLEWFPFLGRATDDPAIRVLPVVRYPYLVFYEVSGEEVIIHHIRHGRRRPLAPGANLPEDNGN
jgi:addiction module RelE/StbE family toxin